MNARTININAFEEAILKGNRALLARAITLVESTRTDHMTQAEALVERLWPRTGGAVRVGITGVPGVGKSTFIEGFGSMLTGQGHKVAVLAVDPTSSRTGGSILGDKTRMTRLGNDPNAFIRPSPTAGTLGGVTRKTRETMALCEAAGHDVILVETVGVGQSETVVADMVDFFLVLMLPGAGDELQGIKKGILELADMIAVNKADGDNKLRAQSAVQDYQAALHIMKPASPTWSPPVIACSGLKQDGLEDIWGQIKRHRELLSATGEFAEKRRRQQTRWMWSMLEERLFRTLTDHPDVRRDLPAIESQVAEGSMTPTRAVSRLLGIFGVNAPDLT